MVLVIVVVVIVVQMHVVLAGWLYFPIFWRILRRIIVSSSLNVRIYHFNYLGLDFTFWEVLDSWVSLYLLYFERFVEILCFIFSQFSNWHASRNLFISCRLLICWCIVVHSIVKSPFFFLLRPVIMPTSISDFSYLCCHFLSLSV